MRPLEALYYYFCAEFDTLRLIPHGSLGFVKLHLAFMLGRSYIFQTFVESGARGSTASHPPCSEASCPDKHYQTYLANQRSSAVPDLRHCCNNNSTVIVGRRDITSATAQAPSRHISTRLIPNFC